MTDAELIFSYPLLFHAAEPGSWASIESLGLLSTSALLDLFEVVGERRAEIEGSPRKKAVILRHPERGVVTIRDQKPLSERRLAGGLLTDMSVSEWCMSLNRRVFFWVSEHRLSRLLTSAVNRHLEHDVLIVDTASLLRAHSPRVTLAPYNTGTTVRSAPKRGSGTFAPISEYDFARWRSQRSRRDAVVELAVDHSVPDIREHVRRVDRRRGSCVRETLFERG